jgi:hypothetical protein
MKAKPKKKTKSSKVKDKLQEYYDSLDLMSWYESFTTDINENGTLKYKTVWSFIKAKTKEKWKQQFLWYILGPLGQSEEYKKFTQYQWEEKRNKGFWYSSEKVEQLKLEVKKQGNALASMRELGSVNLAFISRITSLAEEIDREYSGRIFLSNLSAKENNMRARSYTMLIDQLFGMVEKAQIMYGRSQGMDLEKLGDFFNMLQQGANQSANMGFVEARTIEGTVQDTASAAMSKVMDMVMKKAASSELELPDPEMNDIIRDAAKPTLVIRK